MKPGVECLTTAGVSKKQNKNQKLLHLFLVLIHDSNGEQLHSWPEATVSGNHHSEEFLFMTQVLALLGKLESGLRNAGY